MSEHRAVVDRVEGEFAILEIGGITVDFPVSLLPEGTCEGQIFCLSLAPIDDDAAAEASSGDSPMNIQL